MRVMGSQAIFFSLFRSLVSLPPQTVSSQEQGTHGAICFLPPGPRLSQNEELIRYWAGQKVRSVLSKNETDFFIFTKNFIEQHVH